MVIARDAIAPAVLPRETVQVDAIGGEVVVQGFTLAQVLKFSNQRKALVVPLDGESDDDAKERAGRQLVELALSWAVLADDGLPVYSAQEWGVFGGQHSDVCLQLYAIVSRLSGLDPRAEKKS